MIFLILLIASYHLNSINCINSYIYLNDKSINEEIPIGSFVIDLNEELKIYNKSINNQLAYDLVSNQQFTLLEDSKVSNGFNSYFEMNSEQSGQLITKRLIDRETMCSNRQCAEPCEQINSNKINYFGSCRINLKVLLLPSYNILNLNVLIQDINDNQPKFAAHSIQQEISENVPIGYKIPIDLAYDPDIGRNKIQSYELISEQNSIKQTFKLAQNLNESQLYLVVNENLDRENISAYSFKIAAYDGGQPALSSTLNVSIKIMDINDNNPIFEKKHYSFSIKENTPVDTVIGSVKANDLDDKDLNGKIKYSFVDKSNTQASSSLKRGSLVKHFDLDEDTGVLKLKSMVDYENEKKFILTVEARDAGVGSLPSYTSVEINIIDVNDNAPEIGVSFLNTLSKNLSILNDFKYDVYLPENTKTNKFLAHVNINDKDSNENGRFDWLITINNKPSFSSTNEIMDENSVLKLTRLNNNSFTLNVGNTNMLDKEIFHRHNISMRAWDHGNEKQQEITYFNFSIILVDVNDNAPIFEKSNYELSITENNEPFQVIFKIKATDADSPGPNSNITYSFKETVINDYLSINSQGVIMSKVKFDREKIEKFIFNVIATDHGQPTSLSGSANVILNILDLNDNKPNIFFNTSYYHRFYKLDQEVNNQRANNAKAVDNSLYIRIGEDLPLFSRLIDFRATDKDLNENAKVEFILNDSAANNLPFKINRDGQFTLIKSLNKTKQNFYDILVICRDFGRYPGRLSSMIQLTIEIVDSSEFCIKMIQDTQISKTKYFNRDFYKDYDLFTVDYLLKTEDGKENKNVISFELMTYQDLIEIRPLIVNREITRENSKTNQFFYRLEIKFKDTISKYNISRMLVGKYTIKIKLIDSFNPTCSNLEQFSLIIGSNLVGEKEITNYLETSKNQLNIKNKLFFNDEISTTLTEDEESDQSNDDVNDQDENKDSGVFSFKNTKYRVKPATFMDSDYILLFILIIIILITGILLAFIGIICFCNKIKKKQYNKNQTLKKKHRTTLNEMEELTDLADTDKFMSLNSSKKVRSKIKKYSSSDLNSTNTSNSSSHDKTHYTLVHDKLNSNSNSNSSTTNDTLYRDPDDPEDEFGIISASVYPVRQFSSREKNQSTFNQLKYHQSHPRYIYSTNLANIDHNIISNYDHESNSNPESVIDSTTIDDSKSSSSNNDFEINNNNNPTTINIKNSLKKLKIYKSQNNKNEKSLSASSTSNHSSSSAYSSISNSENANILETDAIKVTTTCESNFNNKQETNFLSFKKAGTSNKNINSNFKNNRNRTSFNL